MRKNVELNNVTYYGVTKIRTVENGEETYWVPEERKSKSKGEEINFQDKSIDIYYEDLSEGKIVISPDGGYNGFSDVVFKVIGDSGGSGDARLQDKTFTSNGTYTADSGYDGLSTVTVSVNVSGGSSTDGMKELIEGTISGSLDISDVTRIHDYTFCNKNLLRSVSFPSCTYIENYAFSNCINLTTISFPACKEIGIGAFENCIALTTVSFPACISIRSNAFTNCSSLTSISLPVCTNIEYQAFIYCSNLVSIFTPACIEISTFAFAHCRNLTIASFPSCSVIHDYAFYKCSRLSGLYLTGSVVVSLAHSGAFSSTPIAGYTTYTDGQYGSIYIPSSLYSQYISTLHWSYFSERFVSI